MSYIRSARQTFQTKILKRLCRLFGRRKARVALRQRLGCLHPLRAAGRNGHNMKCWIITKKQLITAYVAAAALFVCATLGISALATDGGKKLPVYGVQTDKKQVAISFDAAWGADDTDKLISILGEYKVPATFFVVGGWVDKYPDEVAKLAAAGHRVENHSATHPYMTRLSKEQMVKELSVCNEKIAAVTGRTPKLFRPPYGDYNNTVIEAAQSIDMQTIQWSVDSLDWQDSASVQSIAERVINKAQNGSIILCHNDAKYTPEALPTILKTLQDKGYEFVLIENLIYKDNYEILHDGTQVKK